MGTVKYTGPVASFHCPTNAEIKSLKVHFSPNQEGTGNPSPENVREIVGWNGVEVYHGNKTVIWNQWLKPYDDTNWQSYSTYINVTFSNGIATSEWVDAKTGYTASIRNTTGTLQSEGQIWYASYMVKSDKEYGYGIEFCGGRQHRLVVTTKTNEWYHVSAVDSYYRGTRNYTYVANCSSSPTDDMIGMIVYSKSPLLINLTQMFGAGNEPTKEEFESQCALNGIDLTEYHDYSEGVEIPWKTNNTETYQVEFPVLGKNKFDKDTVTNNSWIRAGNLSEENPLGSIKENASGYTLSSYIPVYPNTTYTIKYNASSLATAAGMVFFSEQNSNSAISGISLYYQTYINSSTTREYYTFTTPDNCHYLRISTPPSASDVQLELGSTATTYEPYNPNHTVYGGWVDLISGEVCEEYGILETKWGAMGNANVRGSYERRELNVSSIGFIDAANSAGNLNNRPDRRFCNIAPWRWDYYGDQLHYYTDIGRAFVFLPINSDDNIVIRIVCYLATSNTYNLAPTQLQTFLGQNNVWSNADYVEVEYDLHETQDILARKNFIMASQPHVEEASGAIATFTTDMAAKLKECKVGFKPKQDLHGYSKPWVGGAGKNLFNIKAIEQNPSDTTMANTTQRIFTPNTYAFGASYSNFWQANKVTDFSVNNNTITVASSSGYGVGFAMKVKPETYYTVSATKTGDNKPRINNAFYDSQGNYLGASSSGPHITTFETPADTDIMVLIFTSQNDSTATFTDIQVEEGQTATSYEPYENICPIEGWTGMKMYRTGKNLLDEAFLSNYTNYLITGNYGYKYTEPIFLKPNTVYKFSFTEPQTYETTRYWAVKAYDDDYSDINNSGTIRYLVNNKNTNNWSIATGVSGAIRFAVYGGQSTLDDIWNNTTVQLELGSTATEYEQYNGETIPITFPITKNLFDEVYDGITSESIIYRSIYVGNDVVTASTTTPRYYPQDVPSGYSNLFVFPGQVTSGASTGMNDICVGTTRTITPVDGYITIAYRNRGGVDPRDYHTQIEVGSTATTYEPYRTIYGGYVDLVNGKVWKTHEIVDLGTFKWVYYKYGNRDGGYSNSISRIMKAANNAEPPNAYCSALKMIGDNDFNSSNANHNSITCNSNATVKVVIDGVSDSADITAAVDGMLLVYELAEPIHYTITPSQLKSLRGINNVYSNTDETIQLKYWKH